MCSSYCPCGSVIQTNWGERSDELASRNFSGSYKIFQSCYLNLVANKIVTPLPDSLVALISYLENKYTCSGLCVQPLFWFTKDVSL